MKVKMTFAVLALAALALALPASSVADSSRVVHVDAGESIQAAIDAASPGTTIEVEEGTYKESLEIKKDGIRLVGEGRKETHIVPPDPLVPGQGCVFEQTIEDPPNPPATVTVAFGICVGDPQADPPVRVKDVRISHLSVTGFNGMGIFLFGVDNGVVKRVIASDNGEYGIFANNSTGTHISRNVTSNDGEAGIYVGDSPNADATVWKNVSYGSNLGIFIRDAANGKVMKNKVFDNCAGILFLNTEESPPGEPVDVADWLATRNKVVDNNRACPPVEGPPFSGIGIAVLGGVNIDLIGNGVFGNRTPADTPSAFGGGIVVVASDAFATPSTETTVAHNTVLGNDPDLFWDEAGSGNTFVDNVCESSVPDGLCGGSGNGGGGDDGNGNDNDNDNDNGNHGNRGQGHDDTDGDDDNIKGKHDQPKQHKDDDDNEADEGKNGHRQNSKEHSKQQDRDDD